MPSGIDSGNLPGIHSDNSDIQFGIFSGRCSGPGVPAAASSSCDVAQVQACQAHPTLAIWLGSIGAHNHDKCNKAKEEKEEKKQKKEERS